MDNIQREKWGREDVFRDGDPIASPPPQASPGISHPESHMWGLNQSLARRRDFL